MKKITYKDSGVNIDEGNKAVELIKQKVARTYDSNVIGDLGSFSGAYSLSSFMDMKEPVLLSATDGVGTKLKLAQMMDRHDSVGIDLVAMCVNDLICQGAKPLFFLDYIAVGSLDSKRAADIVGGISNGCIQSSCALIGGETAEMPGMYSDDEYDLAGFSVGISDRQKLIDGKDIVEGDVVIGLKSTGFHSNGYSLVRKIFLDTLGWNLDDKREGLDESLGEVLLRPTKIYVNTVMRLLNEYKIKGIAHITGGGLVENLPRVLPEGLGAEIKKDDIEKLDIFELVKSLDLIEEDELYRSFNMGVGMTMVVDSKDADEIIRFINENTDDRSFAIGTIMKGEGVTLC